MIQVPNTLSGLDVRSCVSLWRDEREGPARVTNRRSPPRATLMTRGLRDGWPDLCLLSSDGMEVKGGRSVDRKRKVRRSRMWRRMRKEEKLRSKTRKSRKQGDWKKRPWEKGEGKGEGIIILKDKLLVTKKKQGKVVGMWRSKRILMEDKNKKKKKNVKIIWKA